MPELWLPGEAARGVISEREGLREAERVFGNIAKRLKAIDSRLNLFLCDRDEYEEAELRKGFYYVYRRNEDGTIAMWEVSHEDGSYREPDEAFVEAFRRGDPNTVRDPAWERQKRRERERRLKEHREAHEREERAYRTKELADFRFRTQLPFGEAVDRIKKKDPA